MTDNLSRLASSEWRGPLHPAPLRALLTDGFQLPPALPDAGRRLSEFLVRDVEVSLRLLDVGVAEHQLNRADVDTIAQESTRALVSQIVPVEINLFELRAIGTRPF